MGFAYGVWCGWLNGGAVENMNCLPAGGLGFRR